MRRNRLPGMLVVLLLIAAACGDDDGPSSASTSFTSVASTGESGATGASASSGASGSSGGAITDGPLSDSFRGVTKDTIKLGVVYVNYDTIKDFVDYTRGDQEKIFHALIDDLNANGGVLGRKIVPTFRSYSPIGNADSLAVCVALTEDEQVFAVLGAFIDFSGDAQLCLTRDHQTIHVGHELKQDWISKAPPGLLVTGDISNERRNRALVSVLRQQKTLDGKTVAVMSAANTKDIADAFKADVEKLPLKGGSQAVLDISGPDTSAALAQLDAFIEKWKTEGVNAIVIIGADTSSRQFVEKIRPALPGVLLLTDSPTAALNAGRDLVKAGISPNPYEGIITFDSLNETSGEQYAEPAVANCLATYERQTGERVPPPAEQKPGADGKRVELYQSVRDACHELSVFTQVATRAGTQLTNDAWTKAIDSFGSIKLPGKAFASFKAGKYDGEDGFRLQQFAVGEAGGTGGWKNLTDIVDASK